MAIFMTKTWLQTFIKMGKDKISHHSVLFIGRLAEVLFKADSSFQNIKNAMDNLSIGMPESPDDFQSEWRDAMKRTFDCHDDSDD